MTLENKLELTNFAKLAREEERISKKKAAELFDCKLLDSLPAGKFETLQAIHKYLFEDICDFAGEIRTVNIEKGNFRAHPFHEGNGRSTRIWLDHILKNEIGKVVDWSKVDKEDYLLAMERSPIKDVEIKVLLKAALTDDVNDRTVYMKGIDASYHYEGYNIFRTEDM